MQTKKIVIAEEIVWAKSEIGLSRFMGFAPEK